MLFDLNTPLQEVKLLTLKELRRSTVDRKHPCRFFTLGSFNENRMRLRYVVLREIDEKSQFWIFSDSRAEKVIHFQQNPQAVLCFYHPKKMVQITITATAQIHHQTAVSQEMWKKVQGNATRSYTTIKPPGMAISRPKEGHQWDETLEDTYFCPISFTPYEIEVLQLNNQEHLRAKFILKDEKWEANWITP